MPRDLTDWRTYTPPVPPPPQAPHLSPDGRFFWDGAQWRPIVGLKKSKPDRRIRIGIPAIPWVLLLGLTAIAPTYPKPLVTNVGGIVALGIAAILSAAAWFTYPVVSSPDNRAIRILLTVAWTVVLTLPGLLIVLLAPAAISIYNNPSLQP